MRVFVSWSGDRSGALARTLRDWLPFVVGYTDPWVSETDIGAGDRWATTVASELAQSNFGLLCITSENVNAPWLLFEAGALAKALDESKVIPLLFDLEFSDITGPLAQFQAKKIDKAGIWEVINAIQRSSPGVLTDDRVQKAFDMAWPNLEESLGSIPRDAPDGRNTRQPNEILEELVESVRSLDGKIRTAEHVPDRPRGRGFTYGATSQLVEAIITSPDRSRGDPIEVLILAGYVRETAPWFYDLVVEAYQAIRRSDLNTAESAFHRLETVLGIVGRGPVQQMFMNEFALFMEVRAVLKREISVMEPF